MPESLVSSLAASLGDGPIHRIAADTGASEEVVWNGFLAAASAILSGMAKKADEPNGIRQMFDLVTGGANAFLSGSVSEFDRNAYSMDPGSYPVEPGQRLLSA